MHRVIKKALATFERESKLPSLEKGKAWHWLKTFCVYCEEQEASAVLIGSVVGMPKDRLLAAIASWVKWKFNRRGEKEEILGDNVFQFSLGYSTATCPSCTARKTISCEECSLHAVGHGCCVKEGIPPYHTAVYEGRKTPLVNALWEAVEWAVKHEGEVCVV